METTTRTRLVKLLRGESNGYDVKEFANKGSGTAEENAELARRSELKCCVDSINELGRSPSTSKRALRELQVLCAEAAIWLDDARAAEDLLGSFLLQGCARDQFYCRAMFIQAKLDARKAAKLQGQGSIDKTLGALQSLLRVINICQEPSNRPVYDFLVFNASVLIWQVLRPVQRSGLRSHCVDPLRKTVAALTLTEDPNLVWRGRLSVALAYALEEVGDMSSAQNECKSAIALFNQRLDALQAQDEENNASKERSEAQQALKEAERLSIHLGQASSTGAAKSALGSGDAWNLLQCVRSGILPDIKELEEALKVLTSKREATTGRPDAAYVTSIVSIGKLAVRKQAFSLAAECLELIFELPAGSRTALDDVGLDLLRAEWLADSPNASFDLFNGKVNGEDDVVKFKAGSGTEREQKKKLGAIRLARRIEAIKTIERALASCTRLDAPDDLEECCVTAWNVGLPLLQPHLKGHVHKTFLAAANALEAIDSPMLQLRAHLHTEIAKCEAASEFLSKASTQTDKALQLDFGAGQHGEEKCGADSELEKFLKPLRHKLKLKSNIYSEPEGNYEQALLQVEQAKGARERQLKITLLSRAASLLAKPEGEESVVADAESQETRETEDQYGGETQAREAAQEPTDEERAKAEETGMRNKDVLVLWGEIAKMAWAEKHLEVTGLATNKVQELSIPLVDKSQGNDENSTSFGEKGTKEIQRLCAEISFIVAETFAERIEQMPLHEEVPLIANLSAKALGLRTPNFVAFDESGDDNDENETQSPETNVQVASKLHNLVWQFEESAFDERLAEYKQGVIDNIIGALRIGVSLQEDWLVENAVTYLWNYHLHLFNGPLKRFEFVMPSLITALIEARAALSSLQSPEQLNAALCAGVCCALAQALEALARDSQAQEELTVAEENAFGGRSSSHLLSRAIEECRIGIACGGSLENVKELYATLHRCQRVAGNKSEPLPSGSPRASGFCILELLRLPEDLVSRDEKTSLLAKAITELQSSPEQVLPEDKKTNLLGLEIWTRLSREALDMGDELSAEKCASTVIAQLDLDGDFSETHALQWRWFSLAECLIGRIKENQAIRVTHDKTVQDSLRESALRHLCLSAEHGVRAQSSRVVLDAGREVWKVAASLLNSVATRSMLFSPLQIILRALSQTKEKTDMQLRMLLYTALIECFKDVQDWTGGLAAVVEAFKVIPQRLQKSLWEARVIFSSKLGKDVAAGLHKMKEGTPSLQAKAWITLARSSSNANDQLKSYLCAVDLLKESFERGDVLVELAEWLHANHFDRDQVTQCLLSAADLILDVKDAEEKAAAAAVERQAEATKSNGCGANLRASSPTSVTSRTSRVTHRTRGSLAGSTAGRVSAASKSTSASATREVGDPMPDAPGKLDFGLSLRLVQIFTMLGRSVSHNKIRSDMALIAYEHLTTAWRRFVFDFDRETDLDLGTILGAARDSSLLEDAKFRKRFEAIERVSLAKHYLVELGNLLQESGHHLLSTSAFAMIELLCAASANRSFGLLARLKTLRCLVTANQSRLARELLKSIDLDLEEKERQFYASEVEQILAQRKAKMMKRAASTDTVGTVPPEAPPTNIGADKLQANAKSYMEPTRRRLLHRLKIREVWALAAEEMIALGYIFHAKQLLQEVALHNEAYDDDENSVRYHVCEARVAILEGKEEIALEHALAGMHSLRACGGGSVLEWLRVLRALVECLHLLDRSFEVQAVLRDAVVAFEQRIAKQGSVKDLDLEVAASYVETLLAEQVLVGAKHRAIGGGEWRNDFQTFQKHVRNAQDRVLIATKPNCACIAAVDVLVRHCDMWKVVYDCDAMQQHDAAYLHMMDGLARASHCAETLLQMVQQSNQVFLGVSTAQCEYVSLPIERFVGRIQMLLGSVELENATRLVSPATGQEEEAHRALKDASNPVERWLEATAPPRVLNLEEIEPHSTARACARLVGAYAQLQAVPALSMQALLAAGKGLARVAAASDPASDAVTPGAREEAAKTATELLERALHEGIAHKDFAVTGQASLELLQLACYNEGGFRTTRPEALEYLLRYQSECARSWLESVLEHSACDKRAKLACFFRMKRHLESELVNPTLRVTPSESQDECESDATDNSQLPREWPFNGCKAFLERTVPVNRLDCSRNMTDILRSVPQACSFLVLASSPDHKSIFVSLFSKQTYRSAAQVHQVRLSEADAAKLSNISEAIGGFPKRLAMHIVGHDNNSEYEFERCDAADSLEEEFQAICQDLRQVLEPAVTLLLQIKKPEKPDGDVAEEKEEAQVEEEFAHAGAGRDLVILADERLARLPLEALIEVKAFKSVSRDFSAHFFAHRLQAVAPNTNPQALASTEGDIEPVVSARPVELRAVVDPLDEEGRLVEAYLESKQGPWNGHVGNEDGIPSASKWQQTLWPSKSDPFQFLFVGPGPLFSYAQPLALSALDMSDCWTAVLLDRAYNDVALRSANKRESFLKPYELELQQPLETTAILSMCGVNTVVANQWSNSISTNATLLKSCIAPAASASVPLAQAIKDWAEWQEEQTRQEKQELDQESGESLEQRCSTMGRKLRVKLNTVAWGIPF